MPSNELGEKAHLELELQIIILVELYIKFQHCNYAPRFLVKIEWDLFSLVGISYFKILN